FSAVCEELFFRLFLISVILKVSVFSNEVFLKITAVVTQALAFMIVHQNYYGDPGMLFGVFLGGCIFGIAYVWKRDISITIFAHFLLNLIATANWLVRLSSETKNIIIIALTIILPLILIVAKKAFERFKQNRVNQAYVK
ncbi:MAG: CPBP family intramembrane metalloprotease, partial [Ignavibacteria bacterium]|nr:CPBP family intramembrane metalloprotease [Ignavibacteria bacterium]